MTAGDLSIESAAPRVRYFERQFLRLQDFTDEQSYHLAALRRHQIAHHIWGIVHGLDLAKDPDGRPVVRPGLAVDGYGRTLVLPYAVSLPLGAFDERASNVLDVWLVYNRAAAGSAAAGYAGCIDPRPGARNATLPVDRELETPVIELQRPEIGAVDRRQPPGARTDFEPQSMPSDDPSDRWPVFLGQITRRREKPDDLEYVYEIDTTGRPYAGLVGEDVVHPDGTARVHLGSPDEEGRRFAVWMLDANNELAPRLAVTQEDELVFYGPTRVRDELIVDGGEIAFPMSDRPQDGERILPGPHPWQMYPWFGKVDESDPTGVDVEQLRLEIGKCGPVVIGGWGKRRDPSGAEVEQFWPCLSVDENCNVRVHGNLVIEGNISKLSDGVGAPPAPPPLSADFAAPQVSEAAAATFLGLRTTRLIGIPPEVIDPAFNAFGVNEGALAAWLAQPEGMAALVDLVEGSPSADLLINELSGRPRLGASVVTRLGDTPELRAALNRRLTRNPREITPLFAALLGDGEARKRIGQLLTGAETAANGAAALIEGLRTHAALKRLADELAAQDAGLAKQLGELLNPCPVPDEPPAPPAPTGATSAGGRTRTGGGSRRGRRGGTPDAPDAPDAPGGGPA